MEQVHPGVYEIRSITYTENRVVMMPTSSSIIIMIMPPAAPDYHQWLQSGYHGRSRFSVLLDT